MQRLQEKRAQMKTRSNEKKEEEDQPSHVTRQLRLIEDVPGASLVLSLNKKQGFQMCFCCNSNRNFFLSPCL